MYRLKSNRLQGKELMINFTISGMLSVATKNTRMRNTILTLPRMLHNACFGVVFSNSMGCSPEQCSRRNSLSGLHLRWCHLALHRQPGSYTTGSPHTTSATQAVKSPYVRITYAAIHHHRCRLRFDRGHRTGILLAAGRHICPCASYIRLRHVRYDRLYSNSHRHRFNISSCSSTL